MTLANKAFVNVVKMKIYTCQDQCLQYNRCLKETPIDSHGMYDILKVGEELGSGSCPFGRTGQTIPSDSVRWPLQVAMEYAVMNMVISFQASVLRNTFSKWLLLRGVALRMCIPCDGFISDCYQGSMHYKHLIYFYVGERTTWRHRNFGSRKSILTLVYISSHFYRIMQRWMAM